MSFTTTGFGFAPHPSTRQTDPCCSHGIAAQSSIGTYVARQAPASSGESSTRNPFVWATPGGQAPELYGPQSRGSAPAAKEDFSSPRVRLWYTLPSPRAELRGRHLKVGITTIPCFGGRRSSAALIRVSFLFPTNAMLSLSSASCGVTVPGIINVPDS